MIDTIHFNIQGSGNADIFNHLIKKADQIQKYGLIRDKTMLYYNHIQFENKSVGRFKGFYNIPSSNYNVNFTYNREKDTIEFNVSIPKFYYGHNIAQFIVDNKFTEYNLKFLEFDTQIEWVYRNLEKFFNDFNNTVCNGKMNINNIIIRRIDMCYNLIFKNENELQQYFEAIRGIRKKYEREKSNLYRNYESSIFYVGKGFSLKIYKKGTEFEKNDYKEIAKYNYQKAEILKEYSKKVLRYEVTFRNDFMSKFYNTYIYRRKCPIWMRYKKMYKLGLLRGNEKDVFKTAMEKRRNFYFDLPNDVLLSNQYTDGSIFTDAMFSKKLLTELCYEFKRKIGEFSLSTYQAIDFSTVDEKDRGLLKKAMNLTKKHPLEYYYVRDHFAVAQYYRYKRVLKKYNQLNNNLKSNIEVSWDYERYMLEKLFWDC